VTRLRAAILALDGVVARIEAVAIALLVALLTGVTFSQVVSRYVFDDPLIWSEEAARYLFVWVTMVGAALGMREGGHYGLDIVVKRLPRPLRGALGTVAALVVLAFLAVLFVTGVQETQLAAMQYSATLPMRMHWAYLALPVGAGLAIFHVIVHVARRGPFMHLLDLKEAQG
jgi:TRAP-type C4-dicarboxylate transport system permease small subunit